MKTLFNYNTRLSFGLGANHVSVKVRGERILFYTGTPQCKKHVATYFATEKIKKDIESLKSCAESANYIVGEYIADAWWGTNID